MSDHGVLNYVEQLTPLQEEKIKKIPFLNIDSYLLPTPFVKDSQLQKDYKHSYVWNEDGEILGYFLVYSNIETNQYQIYKQVTSPFGRSKGIGSAFIKKLISDIPSDALLYLYIWEKQLDSIYFFEKKGFKHVNTITYQKLTFCHMNAYAKDVLNKMIVEQQEKQKTEYDKIEEIGKTRHDAKKCLKLLSDMVNMLSVNNCGKIIEDVNRETTALINMLNSYGDKIEYQREINLKEIIFERVIPFIEASEISCEVKLLLKSKVPGIANHYEAVSRALINIVSNSLDAIDNAGCSGIIKIQLSEEKDNIILEIEDNGIGIEAYRLKVDDNNIPFFFGRTTKKDKGEGFGTRQIYSTFGADTIKVESEINKFTRWTICMCKCKEKKNKLYPELEHRFEKFQNLADKVTLDAYSDYTTMCFYICFMRKMELFCYELLFEFSKYNNIREIYRNILAYWYGDNEFELLNDEISKSRTDNDCIKEWLKVIVQMIKQRKTIISENMELSDYADVFFRSYGQAIDYTIIFTLDPQTGKFFCTDRKLAEHSDFVPYLETNRENLLRGEFRGDLNKVSNPVTLGVWSISDKNDLHRKLQLIKKGAQKLIDIGLKKDKKLIFYNTTYNRSNYEIDTYASTTLGEMAALSEYEFSKCIIESEEDSQEILFVID